MSTLLSREEKTAFRGKSDSASRAAAAFLPSIRLPAKLSRPPTRRAWFSTVRIGREALEARIETGQVPRPMNLARALALASLACFACTKRGVDGDSIYLVHRAQGPIDPAHPLSEASWNRAEVTVPFVRSLDGHAAGAVTVARMLWDDDNLYVAFKCEDPNIQTNFFKDDEPLYTSNVVEIFLNPSGDLQRYAEIELNPANALFDATFTGRRQGMNLAWSSGARHGVALDGTLNDARDVDREWSAELAIPFATLPGMPTPKPKAGDAWRFNMYRLRQGPGQPGEGQAFRPPLIGDFHAVDRFGTMKFAD